MRFTSILATFFAFAVASAQNNTIIVKVGANNGLTYDPPSVTANAGDIIAFQFLSKNHTVTQSTFATPCQIMTTPSAGIDSGYQAVAAGATEIPQWSFTVSNSSAPLWFYCAQTGHCTKGMVFAVNPTAAKSYDAFLANAMGNSTNSTSSTGSTPPSTTLNAGGALAGSGSSNSPQPSASSSSDNSGAASLIGSNAAIFATLAGLVASLVL